MEKIHLIGWALLLIIIGAGAITATVSTVTEAKDVLGTTKNATDPICYVYSISKRATTQDEITNKPWNVEYELAYKQDGKTKGEAKDTTVKTNTEAAVKNAIAELCETEWEEIQAQNTVIDSVVISETNNSVLEQAYDLITRTWVNLNTGQVIQS